jgi:hypothetical protein
LHFTPESTGTRFGNLLPIANRKNLAQAE